LGIAVYNSYCTACHGADGKLKLAGAKDLTVSTLTPEQVKSLLKNGKNAMPKFKTVLSPEELDAVIQHSLELRGK
jgi:mono/diheme cytochrome c family protein